LLPSLDLSRTPERLLISRTTVLCVEMLIAAIGHLFDFPYKEYAGPNARPSGGFRESLIHASKFNDFYHDTVHQVTGILDAHSLYFVLNYSVCFF
jgi:hypothetical protein